MDRPTRGMTEQANSRPWAAWPVCRCVVIDGQARHGIPGRGVPMSSSSAWIDSIDGSPASSSARACWIISSPRRLASRASVPRRVNTIRLCVPPVDSSRAFNSEGHAASFLRTIIKFSRSTRAATRRATRAGYPPSPQWSPDGQWVSYIGESVGGSGIRDAIFKIHLDGTDRTQLSPSTDGTSLSAVDQSS